MITKLFSSFTRECIRPTVYRALRFLAYAVCAVLLADFLGGEKLNNARQNGFALCAALFIFSIWMNFLRLDGMNLPKRLHLKRPKRKKRVFSYGDIDDHIDEFSGDTDDLEEEEKSACIIISGIFDAAACILLSFLN